MTMFSLWLFSFVINLIAVTLNVDSLLNNGFSLFSTVFLLVNGFCAGYSAYCMRKSLKK